MILGIDLGTTHTLVARLDGQQPQLIRNAHGSVLTPSVISADADGAILVGESARHRLITHPEHTASEFKRFMGTDKPFRLGDHCFDASELSALVLKSVKHDAEQHLGHSAERAVVSVPLGVAVAGTGMGEEFLPLIERNTAIPVSETRPLWPVSPAQTSASVRVYQGESFKPEHNLYLGCLDIEFPDDPDKRHLLLTYTYDLDGTLEVEVRFPGTAERYKAYIKDGSLTEDQALAERFERLSALKILPADQQQNREMRSRLERLFEESIGVERERVATLLRTFNEALSTHNTSKIATTLDLVKEQLSQYSRR